MKKLIVITIILLISSCTNNKYRKDYTTDSFPKSCKVGESFAHVYTEVLKDSTNKDFETLHKAYSPCYLRLREMACQQEVYQGQNIDSTDLKKYNQFLQCISRK